MSGTGPSYARYTVSRKIDADIAGMRGCRMYKCPNCDQLIDETCSPNHLCRSASRNIDTILVKCLNCGANTAIPIHAWLEPGAGPEIGVHYHCGNCGKEFDIMKSEQKDWAQTYARMDKR